MGNELKKLKGHMNHKEAAAFLGISSMALYRWRKDGKVPFKEFPKRTYNYSRVDLEKIKENGL